MSLRLKPLTIFAESSNLDVWQGSSESDSERR